MITSSSLHRHSLYIYERDLLSTTLMYVHNHNTVCSIKFNDYTINFMILVDQNIENVRLRLPWQ